VVVIVLMMPAAFKTSEPGDLNGGGSARGDCGGQAKSKVEIIKDAKTKFSQMSAIKWTQDQF
jgi:hypothetical protein